MEQNEIATLKNEITRLNKIITVLLNQNDALNEKIAVHEKGNTSPQRDIAVSEKGNGNLQHSGLISENGNGSTTAVTPLPVLVPLSPANVSKLTLTLKKGSVVNRVRRGKKSVLLRYARRQKTI